MMAMSIPMASASENELIGDVNNDCVVNIFDLVMVARHWGSRIGDPRYDPACDLNGDGRIGLIDLIIVVMHWGDTCPTSYEVTVHVQDSGGNPVSGAKVTIYDELENPVTDTKTTGTDGNASFGLPNGDYKAKVVVATGPIWQGFTVSGAPVEVLVTV